MAHFFAASIVTSGEMIQLYSVKKTGSDVTNFNLLATTLDIDFLSTIWISCRTPVLWYS